jgi:hypothetical protein
MKPQYLPVLGAAQCYAVCAAYNRHKYLQAPKQISLLYRFSSEDKLRLRAARSTTTDNQEKCET